MAIVRFGSNGWRARFDDGFDRQAVLRIASALGSLLSVRYEGETVLVGYDTRRGAERMAIAAGEALAAWGMRVVVSNQSCPTPSLAWQVAHDYSCVAGFMLTACEAPCEYGGIVLCGEDGGPTTEAFTDLVERQISARLSVGRGPIERADFITNHVESLAWGTDAGLIGSRRPRVVVDTLYGTGGGIVSDLLQRVGCEVIAIHQERVSDFRGLHPNACEPWVDDCERTVVENHADLGLVFDGDCSRLALVDESGKLVSQHDLAPLALEHLVGQRGGHGRVVISLASSVRTIMQAERLGCPYDMVPVGAEALHREFAEGDVLLAADERGGLCVPGHLHKRDALLVALMVLELLAGTEEGALEHVRQLEAQVGSMEYGARDIRLDFAAMQRLRNLLPGIYPADICGMQPTSVSHANGLRLGFEDRSWLMVRPSRHRQIAHCVAEAPSTAQRDKLLSEAARLAREIA